MRIGGRIHANYSVDKRYSIELGDDSDKNKQIIILNVAHLTVQKTATFPPGC